MKENIRKHSLLRKYTDRTPRSNDTCGCGCAAARGGGIGGVGGWVNRWQEASGEVRAPAPKKREDIPEERGAGQHRLIGARLSRPTWLLNGSRRETKTFLHRVA